LKRANRQAYRFRNASVGHKASALGAAESHERLMTVPTREAASTAERGLSVTGEWPGALGFSASASSRPHTTLQSASHLGSNGSLSRLESTSP